MTLRNHFLTSYDKKSTLLPNEKNLVVKVITAQTMLLVRFHIGIHNKFITNRCYREILTRSFINVEAINKK